MIELSLAKILSAGSPNLIGRDQGEQARETLGIAQLDREAEGVVVQVPEQVSAVSSSFVSGLFSESIRTLGENRFREKYTFLAPAPILTQIEHGIERTSASVDTPTEGRWFK